MGRHTEPHIGEEISDLARSRGPGSDLAFTVDSMTFIAREAINDVNKGVDAVNAAYEENRNLIALERLQEVFFLGEYLTELNKIPAEQRRHLLDLYRSLIEAGELAESKDYIGVSQFTDEIYKLAEDFPRNRVLSAVETAKSMSDMAVFAASQYRNLGDIDKSRSELQTAIEIWPSNPSIRDFQQETTKLATAGSQGVQIFDDLYKRMDRRGIYERRMDLGFALADDTQRRPLLMDVVEQVARIDLLVNQSKELVKQGEAYAAWELLAEAAKVDPSDGLMNQARAELAPVCQLVVHEVAGYDAARNHSAVDGDPVPVPHFGAALSGVDFDALVDRLEKHDIAFEQSPHVRFLGQPGEQRTFFFLDPSGNALEFKTMKHPGRLFAKYDVDAFEA